VSNIRPFSTADKTALVTLFEEMQRHYGVPCPPSGVIESGRAALPAGVEIMVAETDRIIGFAAFAAIYPGPGLQSGLFMKELLLPRASYRGHGVGKALIQAVARVAVARGHSRVDWTADRTDVGLLGFYSGLGALAQHEKVFYRLTGDALTSLAASRNS
jgi:GNAT superfamily N-acetyltransferase